jgi:hypothetical protein
MTERDQEEQDLRIAHMTVSIEKLRADLRDDQRRTDAEMSKWKADIAADRSRIVWQAVAAAGTAFAGGAASLGLLLHLLGKI